MKNVLFTTTALAALAVSGAAFAKAHDSGNFGFKGETIVGYNDDIEGGLFMQNDITITAAGDIAPGYSVSVAFGADTEIDESTETSASVTFDGAKLTTPAGVLSYDDDMDEATAAWAYYDDTDGMSTSDMPSGEDDAGIKWAGDLGDFGYAISTAADDGDSDIPGDEFALGLGGSFGDVTVGLGYDSGAETIGVSAKLSLGDFGVHLAMQDSDAAGSSVGAKVTGEFGPAKVGVYYATNDGAGASDEYGLFLDFALGNGNVSFDYHDGDSGFNSNFEVDVDYAVNDYVTLYAGYDDNDLNDDGDEGAFYAGAKVMVADNITATIAYAEADEIGGPEFKDGTSLFLTITY